MGIETITSLHNPRVKSIVKLRNGHYRRRTDQFIIEGNIELERALDAEIRFDEIYVCADFFGQGGEETRILRRFRESESEITEVPMNSAVFRKCSYRERPSGLLALARKWSTAIDSVKLPTLPLILVLEKVEKPGNLGSMIRTAEGAGVDLILVTESRVDIYNPNVIRNSRGALFSMPVISTENNRALEWLADNRISAFATTPEKAAYFWEPDYNLPTAFVMGNEKEGLSPFWLEENPRQIRLLNIPMCAVGDSLNVSVATAVVLYEAIRQRMPGST